MSDAATQDDPGDNTLALAHQHAQWVEEIKLYETSSQPWTTKSKRIIKRYKNTRNKGGEERASRYNILWSNVQTLKPALYLARPKPDIERRYRDKDDLGRATSMVLERSISFFLNETYDSVNKQAVLDRLLPGRGTVWVRYEPHFKDAEVTGNDEERGEGYQITDDVYSEGEGEGASPTQDMSESADDISEPTEELADETLEWDYVHWEDLGHTFARTWEELRAVWRKVYLCKDEIKDRFPDYADQIPLDYTPKDLKDTKITTTAKQATIYEIWDKTTGKVTWLHKDVPEILDQQDDPLELTDFWPMPKPLYSTLANDDLIPVPDYDEYQDQAAELDTLTARIASIVRCLKVAGVYNAAAPAIAQLLNEGVENKLIAVEQWGMFAEKGGLKGAMEFLPMQEIAQTLITLYEARDKVKNDLYEITGMADIIRGSTDANETASAQKIKSNFATLRLTEMQNDVKRFNCDLVKIGAEIIAKHFSIDTIKRICGVKLLTEQDKFFVQQKQQAAEQAKQMQQPPQQGMQPHPQMTPDIQRMQAMASAPLPPELQDYDDEELQDLMLEPSWEEVAQLLQSEPMLAYKIDIETDATLKSDQEEDRNQRVQFLESSAKFIQMANEAAQQNPAMAPLLGKMLMFGVRGFKIGKELESCFENTIHKMEKLAENPQQKPDPEMAKVQGQMQLEQQKMQMESQLKRDQMQMDMQKAEAESRSEIARLQAQAQVDTNQAQLDAQLAQRKAELDNQREMNIATLDRQTQLDKTKMDNEAKIIVAQIAAKSQMDAALLTANSAQYQAELSAQTTKETASQGASNG